MGTILRQVKIKYKLDGEDCLVACMALGIAALFFVVIKNVLF